MPREGTVRRRILSATAVVLAAASATAAAADKPAATIGVLTMKEFMVHVIGYAAENVWRWQGWSSDARGEVSRFPKNEAQWDEAESAALTLVALSDALIARPDREVRREWLRTARAMKAAAQASADTALLRNEDGFFEAGSQLYDTCRDCHRAVAAEKRRRTGAAPPPGPAG